MDQAVPIFMHLIPSAPRPKLVCNDQDIRDAWRQLHPVYSLDKSRCGFGVMNKMGARKVLYIGSSHVHHMRFLHFDDNFYHIPRSFLESSAFAGVGGLKWWCANQELNGV